MVLWPSLVRQANQLLQVDLIVPVLPARHCSKVKAPFRQRRFMQGMRTATLHTPHHLVLKAGRSSHSQGQQKQCIAHQCLRPNPAPNNFKLGPIAPRSPDALQVARAHHSHHPVAIERQLAQHIHLRGGVRQW